MKQRFLLNLSDAESNVGRPVENGLFKATYIYFYIVLLLLTSLLIADIFFALALLKCEELTYFSSLFQRRPSFTAMDLGPRTSSKQQPMAF